MNEIKGILNFKNVSETQMGNLKTYLTHNNATGFEGNSGTVKVKGNCLEFGFDFNPESKILEIDPKTYPENLAKLSPEIRNKVASRLISNVMGGSGAINPLVLASSNGYPSHPSKYGVYDYVIPYIVNNSGLDFTFSAQSMDHGSISSNLSTVPNTASTESVELFEADSTKLSGVGVGGTVTYQWGDGQTVISIQFFLNTMFTHSFTVGATGPAASKLTIVVTKNSPVVSGYTYLDPVITITPA